MICRELTHSDISPELEVQASRLFGQLTREITPVPLTEIMRAPNPPRILICLDQQQLLGMASLAIYTVPSGKKGWIEDVVVDEGARGKGLGRKLMEGLIQLAKEKGCKSLFLFTGYTRKPAIAMYENLGFRKKESHLYRMPLP